MTVNYVYYMIWAHQIIIVSMSSTRNLILSLIHICAPLLEVPDLAVFTPSSLHYIVSVLLILSNLILILTYFLLIICCKFTIRIVLMLYKAGGENTLH